MDFTNLTFTMSTNLVSLVNGWEWQNHMEFLLYTYTLQISIACAYLQSVKYFQAPVQDQTNQKTMYYNVCDP